MMMHHSRYFESRVREVRARTPADMRALFAGVLDCSLLADGGRKRLYDAVQTFWMFLYQVLAGNISCHEALQRVLAWRALEGAAAASSNTAAYCKARARLCLAGLRRLNAQALQGLEARAGAADLWRGRPVKVVDGSSLSMPDTPANQARFPQPAGQKPGCGFPAMRIVALFSLATGAMLRLERDALKVAERPLFRQLWNALSPGDVLLADRGVAGFADIVLLRERDVDCVMPNHQRRRALRLKRLGRDDQLVVWKKTGRRPNWMLQREWDELPGEMSIRQIDARIEIPGFRTRHIVIVTTLLDPKSHPADEFAQLYRRRWHVELFLRDIKTSLKMDALKCKTPAMIEREVEIYMLAYNLIRTLIFQAARAHAADPGRVSFKHTADALRQWLPVLGAAGRDGVESTRLTRSMLSYIAGFTVPDRPNRNEPRALKRRPKNYQRLTKPRQEFKELPHRNRYKRCLS